MTKSKTKTKTTLHGGLDVNDTRPISRRTRASRATNRHSIITMSTKDAHHIDRAEGADVEPVLSTSGDDNGAKLASDSAKSTIESTKADKATCDAGLNPMPAAAVRKRRFDIRYMSTSQRYAFIGIAIIFIVLFFFFAGLGIDYLLNQPATWAIWGIWLGALISLIFTWIQLSKLVDKQAKVRSFGAPTPIDQGKRSRKAAAKAARKAAKHGSDTAEAKHARAMAKLSPEELKILADAQQSISKKN